MALSDEERDCRACALEACKRVGLYPASMTIGEFIKRSCVELVEAEELTCPIGAADFTDGLKAFREAFRGCLKEKGYEGFAIFLQALCQSEPNQPDVSASWATWCRFHADRL
jgi:hypothetical protein